MDCMILEKNLLMSLPLLTIDNRLHSAISATLGIVQWISGIVEFNVKVALHFSVVPPVLSPSVDILSSLSIGCCLSWVRSLPDQTQASSLGRTQVRSLRSVSEVFAGLVLQGQWRPHNDRTVVFPAWVTRNGVELDFKFLTRWRGQMYTWFCCLISPGISFSQTDLLLM